MLLSLSALLTDIKPRLVPFIDDGASAAVIYADAFYQPGETRHKAGHFPAEVNIKPGTRGPNGWGYVVRIGVYVMEILPQVLALVTGPGRLHKDGCRLNLSTTSPANGL